MSCAAWWSLPGAAPLHATGATPGRESEGAGVALVAGMLGTPFLPWQAYVSDVAGELLPDGRYAYPVVVVSVPRQAGKTTLTRAVGTYRGLTNPGFDVFYTAQTGKDARERWADLVDAVAESPLAALAHKRTAAGTERITWPNGSTFRCFPPVPKSLHGYTPPLVFLDESFAHDQQTGDDLMGAIGPAQITVRNRQLWIVSTAGTAASTFLRYWIDAGRRGEPGVALFEWAAADGVDVYDPAQIPGWHPALVPNAAGHQLVTAEDIAGEASRMSRSEYERAYGNRWTRTASHLIPPESWDALADDELPAPGADTVFGWDVEHDRSGAALVAVWRAGDRLVWKVVRAGRGAGWLADECAALYARGWRRFAYADDGPARETADELRRRTGLPALELTAVAGRDVADAWGWVLRRIGSAGLVHDGTEALALAAANVVTRPMMDTAAPSRRASAGPVSPLIGGMVASWVHDRRRPAPSLDYRTG